MKTNQDGGTDSTGGQAIGAILARLAGEKKLRHTELVELSNVTPVDMPMFKIEWLKVPVSSNWPRRTPN
jgi:hypothetical protein